VVIEGNIRINTFKGEKIAEGGPGSVVGEMSLIDKNPRSATVVSIGKCKVGVIPSDHLWKLMLEDPILARKILFNIAQVLSTRLRAANVHLDTLMGKAGS
jgi:CRP/FNR family transcriptional regulator, cyclic AMP receptor protein